MKIKSTRFKSAIMVLPPQLYSVLSKAPSVVSDNAQEIILRVDRPLCVECSNKRYYFTKNNCVTDTIFDSNMLCVSQKEIFDTFSNICNFSVYSRQSEINSGYITLKGGHRAGICGTAVLSKGEIVNIKDITSINIRIAREIIGCADELISQINPLSGVLICGSPCSGKTTLIRDLARSLSYKHKISLIDERNELSSNVSGVFQNDIGLCDVFESYIKNDAIIHAVRSMSPDIIVCDEISTAKDVEAVTYALNCGVSFIATVHADSMENLFKRPLAKSLLESGAFSQLVFLDSRNNAGKIKSIVEYSTVLGDTYD
ncbi:MAG: Flp pilus assembly complex ATPase component TadA [Ruminococcus sp.]|nr:Flp pilus assembly complex ATPase component TadA [Ruminococcus sp.]